MALFDSDSERITSRYWLNSTTLLTSLMSMPTLQALDLGRRCRLRSHDGSWPGPHPGVGSSRVRSGLRLDLDALRLGTLAGGLLLTLRGVMESIALLTCGRRVNGGDQRLDDGEAEARHLGADRLLHVEGDVVLAGEGVIELSAGIAERSASSM